METTIKLFRSVKSEATDLGVKIAIENHSGDMQARETRTVIEESGKDFVGSCLDTGNPIWAIEDPFLTLRSWRPTRSRRTCAIPSCSRRRTAPPDNG